MQFLTTVSIIKIQNPKFIKYFSLAILLSLSLQTSYAQYEQWEKKFEEEILPFPPESKQIFNLVVDYQDSKRTSLKGKKMMNTSLILASIGVVPIFFETVDLVRNDNRNPRFNPLLIVGIVGAIGGFTLRVIGRKQKRNVLNDFYGGGTEAAEYNRELQEAEIVIRGNGIGLKINF
jgi:hypothetical protein